MMPNILSINLQIFLIDLISFKYEKKLVWHELFSRTRSSPFFSWGLRVYNLTRRNRRFDDYKRKPSYRSNVLLSKNYFSENVNHMGISFVEGIQNRPIPLYASRANANDLGRLKNQIVSFEWWICEDEARAVRCEGWLTAGDGGERFRMDRHKGPVPKKRRG